MELSRTQSFELMDPFKCRMRGLQAVDAPQKFGMPDYRNCNFHLLPDRLYRVVVSLGVVSCYCTVLILVLPPQCTKHACSVSMTVYKMYGKPNLEKLSTTFAVTHSAV